jgi:Uma2 family endonuclease
MRYNPPMARVAAPTRKVESTEEYLQLEDAASERHEFVDGAMFLMAGGSVQHSQIALRLASNLLEASEDTDCEVVNSDVKLQIGDVYYYPDVMLSCEEDRLERRFFKHPCAIFEVLSESTEPIDRGEKLLRYRTIPSLQMYVLLAQDTARAEVYRRLSDGSWRYDVLEDDAMLEIPCVNLKLPVSSLYRGVL